MSKVFGFLLISMILMCFYQEFVAADCCTTTLGYRQHFTSFCDDGKHGTPCCGVGSCNIFCCHCDGGCRRKLRHD